VIESNASLSHNLASALMRLASLLVMRSVFGLARAPAHLSLARARVVRGGASAASAPAASETLTALREELERRGVDAMIIPSDDPHLSEYVAPCFERRAFVSGFTGSAGTAVVTKERALCWTDGRYWLQASKELGPGWEMVKAGAPGADGVAEWFGTAEGASALKAGGHGAVGIDATCTAAAFADKLERALGQDAKVVDLHGSGNPVDAVWGASRPPAPAAPLRVHPAEHAGEAAPSKLERVREAYRLKGATATAVSALDEVCWLFNIRGGDVACNPVALAYALVEDGAATLFVDPAKVPADVAEALAADGISVEPYDAALERISAAAQRDGAKILVDPARCSAAVANAVPPANRVAAASPVASLKAVKNAAEKAGMRAAHARDGAAVCRAFSEASRRVRAGEPTTERDVDALLFQARSADPLFLEPSFPTIAGAGPNGAVIHGSPGDDLVTRETLLLVDSGGQYVDGTTDATRTMHFGNATAAERRAYTAVLKGHVALDVAVFPEDTAGFVLDAFARKPLWALGYDYAHGTGHGVGAALNVHEGPISVSPRFSNQEVLKRGMVISNEPGYYEADAFGVRIENLLSIEPASDHNVPNGKKFLKFEALTLIPIDAGCVDVSMLDAAERAWIDGYHAEVRAQLAPLLSGERDAAALAWMMEMTAPLREA